MSTEYLHTITRRLWPL